MITGGSNASTFKYSSVFAAILLLVTVFLVFRGSHAPFHLHGIPQQTQHWNGWANVERIFILQVTSLLAASGDSYLDTGFNYDGQQPCSEFPLGNPPYPLGTASDQVNWPVFITTEFNQSVVETYNFARVGATIDQALIPHGSDFGHQLQEGFLPFLAEGKHAKRITSTSLFVTFFGMNDVLLGLEQYDKQEIPWLFDKDLSTWASLVDELYRHGARNFLFMNSPPVERTPYGYPAQGPAADYFNARLADKATNFSITYPDTNVFQFDTHSFFNAVIDRPQTFLETAL